MKISVVSAIGGGEHTDVDIEAHDSIAKMKQLVASQRRITDSLVIIVFRGNQLDDAMTIKAAGMGDGDRCYLITRTEGGSRTNIRH